MTFKGIEVTGTVYENEDETARSTATEATSTARTASQTATTASETATQASQTATQASQTAMEADAKIGDLADLETTVKTDLVSAINEVNAIESLSNINVNLNQSGAASYAYFEYIERYGHVYTATFSMGNANFENIGTNQYQIIGTISLRPLKRTFAIGIDALSGVAMRCSIDTEGNVYIHESVNVVKGSNSITVPFTFIA